ncbi:MAG: pantetheine-phosphate adenylyltransferase [Candidatus Roizmanbacteria bacterium]|nr:MAG: pantetheine-phosphate adenylyltransferase [Candidatus Roizmanbacteria bacterium]
MSKFSYVALGGTFDRLHKGHISIIDFAFKIADKVIIALTVDDFIQNKLLSGQILPFEVRKSELENYLKLRSFYTKSKIISLHDAYGIALEDKKLEAIIVTKETKKNAIKINKLRKKNLLPDLKIIEVPLIKGKGAKVIRSSKIRAGLMNRHGDPYFQVFKRRKNIVITESLRKDLRRPLGFVVYQKNKSLLETAQVAINEIKKLKPVMVISVGDIISASLKKMGLTPDLTIIDLRSKRKSLVSEKKLIKFKNRLTNKPGSLNYKTTSFLRSRIKRMIYEDKKNQILIKGEEDLLALPAVFFAPLNSVVVYGQFDLGIVLIKVTEEIKQQLAGIFYVGRQKHLARADNLVQALYQKCI